MILEGRVAVITGATSGIGRATALLFAREGARVVVVGRDAGRGQDVAAATGGVFCQADLSQAAAVQRMISLTLARFGRLDILVNNAAVNFPPCGLEEFPDERLDEMMAVNFRAVYLGIKYAVAPMRRQGGGAIINIASTGALRPRWGLAAYNASKGAVVALTRSAALELAPARIRVNCICPTATETPMLIRGWKGRDEAATRQALVETIPLGRLLDPEDVAGAALYLASDAARMVTGVILPVDGGRTI